MEFKDVVKTLHKECEKHREHNCLDCTLARDYICTEILKMKNLTSEKIVKIEQICYDINRKNKE